jgi:dipeptidyl-peptidase-4
MRIVLSLLLLLSFSAKSQENLSLSESILGQYRQFYPEHYKQAKWLPGTDRLVYIGEDWKVIESINQEGQKETICSTKSLTEAVGKPVPYIAEFYFSSPKELVFPVRNTFYKYNLETKKAEKLVQYHMDGENADLHRSSGKLAYTLANNLYVADERNDSIPASCHEDPNIVAGQAIARSEFGITKGTFWSPTGKYLAFYQKDESAVHNYPLLDITVTPGRLHSIKYPMAGQSSEKAMIGIFNTEKNKGVYLKHEIPNEAYLTNFGWGPNEKYVYVAIVNREQNHMWLNKYDAQSGDFVKTLFEEKHDKWVEPEYPVHFIPGTEEFLWFSERDGFMHLYRYDSEGQLKNKITAGSYVVKEIMGFTPSNEVILLCTDESGLNTNYRIADLDSEGSKLIPLEEGQHKGSYNPEKNMIYDSYSNLETPNLAQIVNLEGEQIKELINAKNPYEGKYNLGKTELLTLKSSDDKDLHARIIKPHNFDPNKKYPVLVYVYGGPHAQLVTNSWMGGASLWMHWMATEKQYIIFTLDNRGSANRGLEFENGIHRQLGTLEMEDQLVGVNYLKNLPYVDADKMAVHGWSFGGFMTSSLMLREPDVFKVGVAGGPVTDWKFYEIMYGERYMDKPDENPEGYKKASLLNHVSKLKGDLLLIHGTVDDVVVMQHNLALVKAFVDEGILIDFFPYPNHPHNVRGKDRVHLYNKVLSYIDEQLYPCGR